ncbi:unnamed protein product [Rotaria socialis]|nr:unnamed protein product [Rotaria socialis]
MGQWKDDKKHGKGTNYYPNGNKYEGDWIDDKRTGQGILTWPNGNRYEQGYSQMSSPHLISKMERLMEKVHITIALGKSIPVIGSMKRKQDGKINGRGTYYYGNGHKYAGDWIDEKKAGQGVYTWSNGDRYEKEYSQMFIHHHI